MPHPLEPGVRAPDFVLPRTDDDRVRFYGRAGGVPTVVVLTAGAADGTRGLVERLRTALPATTIVHTIGTAASDDDTLVDAQGRVHRAYGADPGGAPQAVVLGPDVRVASTHPLTSASVADIAAAASATDHSDPDVVVSRQAPVLFVPDALSPDWCQRLVELWGSVETVETGVEVSADGRRGEQADTLHKRRRDHVVADRDLLRGLTSHIGARVLPELQQAFAYEARGFEGFKIGCYDEDTRGFFAAHRDNLSPATAHRRFALTLNLNDDYDGGELRFPEFGRMRYRPAAGEALVFSGSHLHEVLPVTRGRRFVLLSFLFAGRGGGD